MNRLFKIIFLFGVFILPSQAFAAISFDSATSTYHSFGVNGCNTGIVCTFDIAVHGANNLLVCQVENVDTDPGVVKMQYNNKKMKHLGVQQVIGSLQTSWVDTFYVVGAKRGLNPLTITTENAQTNGFYTRCASYTGVNQARPITALTQQTAEGATSDTVTVRTNHPNQWVVGFWASAYGTLATPGADTIQRVDGSTAADGVINESAFNPVNPIGSVTMTNVFNRTDDQAVTAFAIRPL